MMGLRDSSTREFPRVLGQLNQELDMVQKGQMTGPDFAQAILDKMPKNVRLFKF